MSELVSASKKDTSGCALQMRDAEVFEDRILYLRRSKTDQLGKGKVVTLMHCWLMDVCPVQALKEYLEQRGPLKGSLF